MDQPATIRAGSRVLFNRVVPRTISTISQTLADRGDPQSIYLGEVSVTLRAYNFATISLSLAVRSPITFRWIDAVISSSGRWLRFALAKGFCRWIPI
jgi:hypothetical protein